MKACGANVPSASKLRASAALLLLIVGNFGPAPPELPKDEAQTALFKEPVRIAQ